MNGENAEHLRAWMNTGSGSSGWFRHLALAIAWLLLWRASALMEFAPFASIWFPPAGLSLAALLLMGWSAAPVLMLCSVLVTFWTNAMYGGHDAFLELLSSGVLFGLAHCGAYGIGAAVLRRIIGRSAMHSTPAIILSFLLIGCLSALVATLAGIDALRFTGMLSTSAESGLWLPWWIGDMAGALVLTPLFLGLLSWRYPQLGSWMGGLNFNPQAHGRGNYLAKLGLSVFLVSMVVLLQSYFGYREVAFGMFFLIIPQMWIVYTESPFRSAVSLAIFSTTTALWVGALGLVEHALVYQFAICVIAASAYFGFAVPVLIEQNNQLRNLAYTDGLTRIANKEHFFDRAEQALSHARSLGRPISLAVLDIDRFKQVNDRYGHFAGDQALISLVRTIKAKLQSADLIGRFGGDEFTLLMPGLGLQEAEALTDQLRQLLRRTQIPGTEESFSVSFGVISVKDNESIIDAFMRADQQLLQIKKRASTRVDQDAGSRYELG